MRRWLKPLLIALALLLLAASLWIWFAFLRVFFVKPGPGGAHLHLAAQVLAGSPQGQPGFIDSRGSLARLDKPIRLARLNATAVVFADINNHAIRSVDLEGRVRTLAGGPGKEGYQDGPAETARFKSPHGVAVRADGAIAVAEVGNNTIRLLVPRGDGGYEAMTLAGRGGRAGMQDGPAATARFSSPHAVLWGPSGELFVADIGNARVRLIQNGQVSTVAGDGRRGQRDGAPGRLSWPMDLCLDDQGTLWIADCGALTLRTWNPATGLGTPFPGLQVAMPHGISSLGGQVLVAEMNGQRILAFDRRSGQVSTLYGSGHRGFGEGELNRPAALLADGGRLWVADLYNHRILALTLPPGGFTSRD
ncbi:MAG: hypothetical protein HY014_10325 [Acidobacteria bacterium]|nr:hypothetical protein [Acidobacteriota bacterium]MBI3488551.1 hypothetical protein [Acidobacteriota bacterium]